MCKPNQRLNRVRTGERSIGRQRRCCSGGAGARILSLRQLKERLLEEHVRQVDDAARQQVLKHAAHEAESLAWTTPFPLLFLPELLKEKTEAAHRFADRQAKLTPCQWWFWAKVG